MNENVEMAEEGIPLCTTSPTDVSESDTLEGNGLVEMNENEPLEMAEEGNVAKEVSEENGNVVIEVDEEVHVNTANFEHHLLHTPVGTIVNHFWEEGVLIEETDSVFVTPRSSMSTTPRTLLGSSSDADPPGASREPRPVMASIAEAPDQISTDSPTPNGIQMSTQEVLQRCDEAMSNATRPRRRRTVANYNEEDSPVSTGLQKDQHHDPVVGVEKLISKTRKIVEDIMDAIRYHFAPTTEKPKGKSAQLKLEEPTNGVYAKKCGFTTARPAQWADALERLLEANNMDSRWEYSRENEKFSECAIKILPVTTNPRKVIVEIKFTPGVILVHGTNHQDWIENIFDAWLKLVETGETTILPIADDKKKHHNEDQSDTELLQLWDENRILRNSVSTLETALSDLRNDFTKLAETCLLYTSPSPRDLSTSRMPSSA